MHISLSDLILDQATQHPDALALSHRSDSLSYAELAQQIESVARGYRSLGLQRSERVAIYLPKRLETVSAIFASAMANAVFVPINPLLKPAQVSYIMRDCNVRILVTAKDRLQLLEPALAECPDLKTVVVIDTETAELPEIRSLQLISWQDLISSDYPLASGPGIDMDMAAILYTSGSTGKPKGVVLSHRNMLTGAHSVASYIGNHSGDHILSVLPLSFDAGFSQLTTAFVSGARVVLLDYLLARDVIRTAEREGITGITAVPPIWVQLSQLEWPAAVQQSLRYIANTGGHMPRKTLDMLRQSLPKTQPFLMYGLTEAFRSTYLPPGEVDRRPDSIGKAIPNAEIMVVREDGTPCAADEPGELVHRGALVAMGYWNDPEKTAQRFKPAPGQPGGIVQPEIAVWSGDSVRMDKDGFLYFIGRKDDMIKTSGYRVSPTEVEEVVYASGYVAEAVALGIPHPALGQAVVVVVTPNENFPNENFDDSEVINHCKRELPNFMVPTNIVARENLPRNPNGKIDRKLLAGEIQNMYQESATGE